MTQGIRDEGCHLTIWAEGYIYETLHKYDLEVGVHLLHFQLSACVQLLRMPGHLLEAGS